MPYALARASTRPQCGVAGQTARAPAGVERWAASAAPASGRAAGVIADRRPARARGGEEGFRASTAPGCQYVIAAPERGSSVRRARCRTRRVLDHAVLRLGAGRQRVDAAASSKPSADRPFGIPVVRIRSMTRRRASLAGVHRDRRRASSRRGIAAQCRCRAGLRVAPYGATPTDC